MQYDDFVLQLDLAAGGDGYVSRVLRSPAGEAEAPFVNPLTPADLHLLWSEAERTRQGGPGGGPLGGAGRPASSELPLSIEELGSRLFAAAFPGPVRACWARSLAGIAQDAGQGDRSLRLKLQLSLDEPRLAPLHEIPWEILFSPEQGGFVGLRRQTPVLRHVRLPLPAGRAPLARPLRLLVVSCEPADLPALSLAGEAERIREALRALPGVETTWLHNPTLEALHEAAFAGAPHILHFMGHGGFEPATGQGALFFAGADRASLAVRGDLLASQLAGLAALRLVFLNACETARASAPAPFAGVATALLRAGIPAVVAMQLPVRDDAALAFSRTVYRRLALGDPIDSAVTEGRLAITREAAGTHEWATPVLFLRAEDSRLFDTGAGEPAEPLALPRGEPAGSRTHPWLRAALLLGCILVLSGLWVGWNTLIPGRTELVDDPIVETPPPSVSPAPEPPVPTASPSPPPKPIPGPPSPEPTPTQPAEPDPHVDPLPAPPRTTSARVTPDSPVTVGGVEVSVAFFQRDGFRLARFSLAPPDGAMLQQPPVMGTGTIEFPAGSGTYRLDVTSLDHDAQSATVRVRFTPA